MPLLERASARWKAAGAAAAAAKLPTVRGAGQARRCISSTSRAPPQSQIRIGWIGVPRSTPDYFPIRGDEHDPRRLVHLAAEHEPAREARLHLRRRLRLRHARVGRAVLRGRRRADRQDGRGAEGVLQRAERRFCKPVPADELSRAKNYVSLRFPGGFETTGDISRRLEDALIYHLPDDYFSKYVPNIEAVTAADVQRVAAEVHPAGPLRRRRRRRSRRRSSRASGRSIWDRSTC